MNKFVYEHICGDEFTASWTSYITLEANSKLDLVTELGCRILDFQKERELNLIEIKKLMNEHDKLRSQSKFEESRSVWDKMRELEKSLNIFDFQGRKYNFSYFVSHKDEQGVDVLCDLDSSILSIDDWFERNR